MPAPPPLSEPAMVSATGNLFLLIIIQTRGKINAKAQRRKGAKRWNCRKLILCVFAPLRLCVKNLNFPNCAYIFGAWTKTRLRKFWLRSACCSN
jgi:hypothetical protein